LILKNVENVFLNCIDKAVTRCLSVILQGAVLCLNGAIYRGSCCWLMSGCDSNHCGNGRHRLPSNHEDRLLRLDDSCRLFPVHDSHVVHTQRSRHPHSRRGL